MVPDNKLLFWPEVACVLPRDVGTDSAKHLRSVIRTTLVPRDERVIVAAALTETDVGTGASFCEVAFNLDSECKKERFFSVYVDAFFTTFLTPIVQFGLAFEAHGQNVLLRARPVIEGADLWMLAGFAIRDSDGIKLHPETLRTASGKDTVLENAANSLAFRAHCPKHHALYTRWMRNPFLPSLRMEPDGLCYNADGDHYLPNMILYQGERWACENSWWDANDVVELNE
ncbi:hypothetical protein BOTBODRAFT_190524 [Botryobasidium botryosum FD-172 SS1]|uniref:Aerobactin siderophore biosynthesis IucA/IucC-like C-terminal domain-containing protein n=1 Tax=Botryobasidium botryosum (strain FD-172 SS1) TaxID=930990 RepID=A0A067MFN6_BOTB1|nr:hypothetical protein BOTBODRAFT_190524 [Botryobasidium botryosum FD-172 SS1]